MRRITVIAALLPTLGLFLLGGGPAKAAGAPPYGLDKWAVIIGIDHFQGKTRPNVGAVGDAHAFHDALVQKGWPDNHIAVLTDGQASQQGIRNAFKWLAQVTANDHGNSFAVVHYSGHVKQASGHEYLWPSD
ncbi:MAG: caspase family protein, partial [Actinobacteria bacterium]|nr:caspase family protein [Actinomycetota bacterium]